MTPAQLARLHARAFTFPRPWSEQEFAELLEQPGVFLLTGAQGFLLGRVIADEAELLTLAVDPDHRRQGIGQALVAKFLIESATRGAVTAFLEVAADNAPALMLYQTAGFEQAGCRNAYYIGPVGRKLDARVLRRDLSPAEAAAKAP
ncbi:MAG: GNAT family N-acetyltransferase [Litoreibacter sp.]|nr:GNAT family N-acetyltransferase [Litoreibacter sp.]